MPRTRVKQWFPDQTIANEVLEFNGDLVAFITKHYPAIPHYILSGHLIVGLEQPPAPNGSAPFGNIIYQDVPLQAGAVIRANYSRAYLRFLPSFSISQTEFDLALNKSVSTPLRVLFGSGYGMPVAGGYGSFLTAYSGALPTSAGDCTINAIGNANSRSVFVTIAASNLANPLSYEIRAQGVSSTYGDFTVNTGAFGASASAQQVVVDCSAYVCAANVLQVILSGGGAGELGFVYVDFHYKG